MKQTDKTNSIWYETEGEVTKVGFTPQFLEKLQECFHIVPGKRKTFVRENGPLMALETNEGLFSITSPVKGVITFFEDKAMNFPEKLTTEDVVVLLQDKPVVEKKKAAKQQVILNEGVINWSTFPTTDNMFRDFNATEGTR